jgi:hypothetical protein
MTNVSYSGNNHKEARSSSRPDINCKISSVNKDDKAANLNDRSILFLSHSLPICSDLADDRKLGYGFTSANELEEVDIDPEEKPRPTFINKKLDPSLQEPMITCTKLRHILLSVEIIIICKSDIIKHILSAPVLKGRLRKWMFALS